MWAHLGQTEDYWEYCISHLIISQNSTKETSKVGNFSRELTGKKIKNRKFRRKIPPISGQIPKTNKINREFRRKYR